MSFLSVFSGAYYSHSVEWAPWLHHTRYSYGSPMLWGRQTYGCKPTQGNIHQRMFGGWVWKIRELYMQTQIGQDRNTIDYSMFNVMRLAPSSNRRDFYFDRKQYCGVLYLSRTRQERLHMTGLARIHLSAFPTLPTFDSLHLCQCYISQSTMS